MSAHYRIEYFSNNDLCWVDDDSTKSFFSLDSALSHLRRYADSDPDYAHRLVKIETIALTVNSETLIAGA